MAEGKDFEKSFRESAIEDGFWFYRIPDMYAVNPNFAGKSMADCILYHNLSNKLYILELKSTKYNSISIQTTDEGTQMIKKHQIISLEKNNKSDDVEGCFIFNFRKEDSENTYIMNIKDFTDFLVFEDKASINEKDIVKYGGVKCEQELKRVKYRYHVRDMLDTYGKR